MAKSVWDRYRNLLFWSIQVISWGAILGFAYVFTPDVDGFKSSGFLKFSLATSFVIGLFCTGLLRAYLKRKIELNDFKKRYWLWIFISVIVCVAAYALLSYAAGYLSHQFFESDVSKVPDIYKNAGWGVLIANSFITIFGWTMLYFAIKLMLKSNQDHLERTELNSNLKQAQLNTLKGQINPHFMFNSLNNIRGLMLEDVERSRDMITKLSEMLRYSLTQNAKNSIALEEELEMVANYIDLSKIQFEERLQFVTNIAPETKSLQIPPMIIQLLVENAAKHGISNLKNGGTIALITKKEATDLLIEVRNSGKLQLAKGGTHLGLKNIRERLQLLYGAKASFSLTEEGDEVVALIKIPLV